MKNLENFSYIRGHNILWKQISKSYIKYKFIKYMMNNHFQGRVQTHFGKLNFTYYGKLWQPKLMLMLMLRLPEYKCRSINGFYGTVHTPAISSFSCRVPEYECRSINCEEHSNLYSSTRWKCSNAAFKRECWKKRLLVPSPFLGNLGCHSLRLKTLSP